MTHSRQSSSRSSHFFLRAIHAFGSRASASTSNDRALSRAVLISAVATSCFINIAAGCYVLWKQPQLNSDFLAFWSFPRFLTGHSPFALYDTTQIAAFQHELVPSFNGLYALLYPPSLLPAIAWLKFVSFTAGETIWTFTGLAACVTAILAFFPPGERLAAIIFTLGSPLAFCNGAGGETGFFTTAAILAGFAALPKRPILAGLFFGLLTLKPQMAFLVPVALISGFYWRSLAVMVFTALAIVLVSCWMFPPSLWLAWAESLTNYQSHYFAARALESASGALSLNISIISNLIAAGLPHGIAWALQGCCSLGVIVSLFFIWRRAPYRLAVAASFAAIFLATPHTYAYDGLPLMLALLILREFTPAARAGTWLAIILFAAPLMILTRASHAFFYAVPETLLYLGILRLVFTTRPNQTTNSKRVVDVEANKPKHTSK